MWAFLFVMHPMYIHLGNHASLACAIGLTGLLHGLAHLSATSSLRQGMIPACKEVLCQHALHPAQHAIRGNQLVLSVVRRVG